jgi:LacI family transcriptional regulator
VALLVETSNAFARGLLAGVEDYIRTNGHWNVYLSEHGRGEKPPEWLTGWDGDGIIARVENLTIAWALADMPIPVVDLSSHRLLPKVSTVTTDNVAIAKLAWQHFFERGFRHFAFCGDSRFPWSVARGEAFAQLAREAALVCEGYAPNKKWDTGSDPETDSIARWLGGLPLPCAVFACYDARGQQVLDACRRAGISVPEQIAVLGVDNDELLCDLSPPPLSSVAPNTHRAGWLAADLLAKLMAGEKVAAGVQFVPPVGVVTRQSTDTLAVDDPKIAGALRYIRQHACEGIHVDDVLAHFPMARRALEQRMKTIMGRTPHEEIRRVQLQRARELLCGTSLTLAEIAERCGFKYTEYLTVAFKRETGHSPNQYRKTHGRKRQIQ